MRTPFNELREDVKESAMIGGLAIIWAILLVVLIVVFPPNMQAQGSRVFRGERGDGKLMALRIHYTRCENPVVLKHLISRVLPEILAEFKSATLTWDGRDWASCWIERGGYVHSVDEEGARLQSIPFLRFKDEAV